MHEHLFIMAFSLMLCLIPDAAVNAQMLTHFSPQAQNLAGKYTHKNQPAAL